MSAGLGASLLDDGELDAEDELLDESLVDLVCVPRIDSRAVLSTSGLTLPLGA